MEIEHVPHVVPDGDECKQQEEADRKMALKLQRMLDEEQTRVLYQLQFDSEDANLLYEIEQNEDEEDDDVEWIASHLNPKRIIWSSNPEVHHLIFIATHTISRKYRLLLGAN
jgi:hypothetical protein